MTAQCCYKHDVYTSVVLCGVFQSLVVVSVRGSVRTASEAIEVGGHVV